MINVRLQLALGALVVYNFALLMLTFMYELLPREL